MKLKSNGKYEITKTAQKTQAIRVNFRLEQNEIATPGDKEAYIVIQNPSGTVISEKGTFMLKNGDEVPYTDQTVATYNNADLDVVMFVENITQKICKR